MVSAAGGLSSCLTVLAGRSAGGYLTAVPRSRDELPIHPLSWRSWHLRLILLLIALVLAVRLVWGWHVARTLRSQVEEMRGRGEVATVDDLVTESVPDAENAWDVQTRAAQATRTAVSSPRASNDEYRPYPPFPDYWMKRASDSEKAHAQAFALARQARQLSRVQLRDRVTSPVAMNYLPSYNTIRNLANTVSDGALYSHVRGDDVEAIERVRDVLHVARSLYADPFPISQLVGRGVDALAFDTAQTIAPGLRLDTPATRQRVMALIADLLDEGPAWRGMESSIRMSCLETTDLVDWRARDFWLVHPAADREVVRTNRGYARAADAGRLRNAPQVRAALADAGFQTHEVDRQRGWGGTGSLRAVPRYSRWFLLGADYLPRYFEVHFRAIAERRVTAVSLAAQLYRADHGHWPARLDELVPAYLPAVPADPYHEDARPLGYVVKRGALPGGGDRPMVYFDAGKDDPVLMWQPVYSWYQEPMTVDVLRQYRDLARFVPPPSPKAVDGDPEKPDAGGDEPKGDDNAK